jgi:hypothetical protein
VGKLFPRHGLRDGGRRSNPPTCWGYSSLSSLSRLGSTIKFYEMDQCPAIVLFVLSKIDSGRQPMMMRWDGHANCVCTWGNHFLYAADMDKTVMSWFMMIWAKCVLRDRFRRKTWSSRRPFHRLLPVRTAVIPVSTGSHLDKFDYTGMKGSMLR